MKAITQEFLDSLIIGIGRDIARQDAVDQMWKLAGYGRMELEFWKHQIAGFADV